MLKRRTWLGYTAGLAAATLIGGAGLAGASAASAVSQAAPSPAAMTPIGTVPGIPPGARISGPEARSATLHITVALRPADPRGLRRCPPRSPPRARRRSATSCARAGSRPGSGRPSRAAAAVRAWLRRHGLATGATLGDGLLLPASGPVARIEAAFRTAIDRVRLADGRTALLNRRAPEMPAGLRRWVSAVIGLSTVHLPGSSLARGSVPGPRACRPARRTRHVYTAAWLAHAYRFNPLYHHRDFGQHVTVALFELADYASRDIRAYTRCYHVHPPVRRVRIDGGTSVRASGAGTLEVTADIEVVAAMAPRARILVYQAPLSGGDQSIVDTYGAIAQQDRAQVVSSSWGGCEPLAGGAVIRVEAQLFQEMALQGQSMMAAAGDSGSEGCLPDVKEVPARVAYSLQVGNPASQPFVTAVGGTTITRYGSPPVQSAWNQTPAGLGFPGAVQRPGRPAAHVPGQPGRQRRHLADVVDALLAGQLRAHPRERGPLRGAAGDGLPRGPRRLRPRRDRHPGYPRVRHLRHRGGVQAQGLADRRGHQPGHAAVGAALAALADEQLATHRAPLPNPSLYRIARRDPRAFTDVRSGDNDYLAGYGRHSHHTCRSGGRRGQPCYPACRGYDMATGLGSPQAGYLVTALLRERAGGPGSRRP